MKIFKQIPPTKAVELFSHAGFFGVLLIDFPLWTVLMNFKWNFKDLYPSICFFTLIITQFVI
jgi:hypothetical protein